MPLASLTNEGTLSIDGVEMANQFGAWGILSDSKGKGGLLRLLTDFAVRGENRLLPSVTGVIMYEHRITETPMDFNLVVVGDVNGQTGATNTDAAVGLEENLDYLIENVILPPGNSTGSRTAVYTTPSGSEREGPIQVLGTTVREYLLLECGAIWIATMHTRIPGGRYNGTSS